MEEVEKQLQVLQTTTDTPQVKYLQHNEIITKLHNLEIREHQTKAETKNQLKAILSLFLSKDEEAIMELMEKLGEEEQNDIERTKTMVQGVSTANKIAKKYKTSLAIPTISQAPDRAQLNPQRTSPREIITVTGKFNPSHQKADFNQMWNKLTSYGQLNYFAEEDYITALTYILEGEAYEALTLMTDEPQSLQYIIDYFAKVYGRRRSINKDRATVDNFTRHKDEPLDICMHRSLISIDRLKHLYSVEAWPEIRDILRRNILTQMISDRTKRYIQIEENKIIEKTGLQIDIDKIIDMAQQFELLHDETPNKEVPTVFKVASGGFTESFRQIKQELHDVKRSMNNYINSKHQRDRSESPRTVSKHSNYQDRHHSSRYKTDHSSYNQPNNRDQGHNRHKSSPPTTEEKQQSKDNHYNATREPLENSNDKLNNVQLVIPTENNQTHDIKIANLTIRIASMTPTEMNGNKTLTQTEKSPTLNHKNNNESDKITSMYPREESLKQVETPIEHQELKNRQQTDDYFGNIYKNYQNHKDYQMKNNILYKKVKNETKLVLPSKNLVEIIKTLRDMRPPLTNTRIRQEVLKCFHVDMKYMNELLQHQ